MRPESLRAGPFPRVGKEGRPIGAEQARTYAAFFFAGRVKVRRPTGTSSIVLGQPSSPVTTYSGYAGKPCSERSSPSISPSVGMRSLNVYLMAYIRAIETTKVAIVIEKLP